MRRCEICERREIAARCAGLDVPELAFCLQHGREHEATCPEIKAGRAQMFYLESKQDGVVWREAAERSAS